MPFAPFLKVNDLVVALIGSEERCGPVVVVLDLKLSGCWFQTHRRHCVLCP